MYYFAQTSLYAQLKHLVKVWVMNVTKSIITKRQVCLSN